VLVATQPSGRPRRARRYPRRGLRPRWSVHLLPTPRGDARGAYARGFTDSVVRAAACRTV